MRDLLGRIERLARKGGKRDGRDVVQIVAQVGAGAASGNAQVLQNNVMSNAVPFTVNTPRIASISPTLGGPRTSVTFTGTGVPATGRATWGRV